MAKITKELMKLLHDGGAFPPRHTRGCLKNSARIWPMPLASKGLSVEEIKQKVSAYYDKLPCECDKIKRRHENAVR